MEGEANVPARIGRRYRVERALGRGGMATVYGVTDEQSGARVALKQLSRSVLERIPSAALLFEREFYTLTQLRHPHIVEAHDYGLDEAGPYYTMELLEGSDLRDLAPCDWKLVCRILRQTATALALLHSRRLIHRDLSPRNLWRTEQGAVKLIDFGAMGTQGALALQLIGTPPFTAPEVYHRQAIDPRTDLYALGAIGYWLLTGAHAYPASRFRDLPDAWARTPSPARLPGGDVPEGLAQLVRSLMSLEMVARPRCAAEVIERIDVLLDEPHVADPALAEGYLIAPSLVGRGAEMRSLRGRLDRLKAGEGGVLVIEGAAGLGRTRLLHELSLAARVAGATVIDANAKAHPRRPYGVAREWMSELRRLQPGQADAGLPTDIRELLQLPDARAELPDDPRERRSRLLGALRRAILDAAHAAPLVLTLDDAELADEHSLSGLAALVADAGERPILAVLTLTAGVTLPAPLAALYARAQACRLDTLSEPATRELLGSIFGDVPHVARLSLWVQQRAEGNVMVMIELLRELVDSGALRYLDGSWVIPREVQSLHQGARLQDAFADRIAGLDDDARELSELWALCDGELGLERAVGVFRGHAPEARTTEAFFQALDRLLYGEILSGADGHYSFRQEGLRQAVLDALPSGRAEALHQRIGAHMLDEGELPPAERLAAASHLMRGGTQRARGAGLVAHALEDQRVLAELAEGAVDAIGEALRVLEQTGGEAVDRVRLSKSLMRCAYYYDAGLADAALPALDELAEISGLTAARALPDSMSAAERLGQGLASATERWEQSAAEQRGLHPGLALLELTQAAVAALGVFVLRFDIPAIARLRDLLSPLGALELDLGLSVGFQLIDLVLDAMRGGEISASARRLAMIERLHNPDILDGIPAESRKHLIATQLHAQGMTEVSSAPRLALERADRIEALDLQMYRGAALQIRFMVELYAGRADRAAVYRDRLDLVSMQEGSGRQTEMWLVRYLVLPYLAWGDVLALRQTVQQLEELCAVHPGYAPFHAIAVGALHHERGQHDEATESLEHALALAPRGQHAAWFQATIVYVQALVAAQRYRSALEAARQALAPPHGGLDIDRLRRLLAPALAVARAAEGDAAAAKAELEGLIAQARADGVSHLGLAGLYEYRARIAELEQDDENYGASVRKMGEHARSCGNPTLISRHELLTSRFETGDGSDVSGRHGVDSSAQETVAGTRVRGTRSTGDGSPTSRTGGKGKTGS